MKLATLDDGTRDGRLVVVSADGTRFSEAPIASMQAALDDWSQAQSQLHDIFASLEKAGGDALETTKLHSPLPRAYEWIDGSAFINHIVLVRKARGAEPPETLETDPLVYQGGSGTFLRPTEDIPLVNPEWGLDFEAEVCVVLGDTPQGVKAKDASQYIKLVMLANDVTLRNLIPPELAKGFGFFTSKPSTAFSPFAVTPELLGDAWRGGRLHLPMVSHINGELVGDPHAGDEMHFSFFDLIEHITKSRGLTAGTIVGSGTISNRDEARGVSCLAERRMREKITTGEFVTPFLKEKDTIRIEMFDAQGQNVFGTIGQTVRRA